MKKIRLLNADEIECRVGAQLDNSASLLLYKDARVDMRLLDEVYGPMNWKRAHEVVNGNLFCTISIWDEDKKEWITKQDVGTESNTEAVKGEASDSFKRAGFNWGIGRELYTAPSIWVDILKDDLNYKGKIKTRFSVSEIEYNDKNEINHLIIVDEKGRQRWPIYGKKTQATNNVVTMKDACAEMRRVKSNEEIKRVWSKYPQFHETNSDFYNACVEMGVQYPKK